MSQVLVLDDNDLADLTTFLHVALSAPPFLLQVDASWNTSHYVRRLAFSLEPDAFMLPLAHRDDFIDMAIDQEDK